MMDIKALQIRHHGVSAMQDNGPILAEHRLGIIVPSVNTVLEPWFQSVAPPGVTIHVTRMLLDNNVTPESLRHMDETETMDAIRRISDCRPHAIAYACTASSIVQGLAYDEHLKAELERTTSRPCLTAAHAILDALAILKVRKIAIASPYTDVIDRAEHAYFKSAGLIITGSANLGISDAFNLAAPTSDEIEALAERAITDEAEALVISCINLNAHKVVDKLEKLKNIPVVTSTTATLWKLMRIAGINSSIQGYGRLLETY